MKDQQQAAKEEEETSGGGGGGGGGGGSAVWDCGSPLYDSYELASVYHLLDRHLMVLPFYRGSGRYSGRRSSDEADEPWDGPSASKGRRATVVGGSHRRRRGREKAKKEKKNKIGLMGMWSAIAFWKK